MVKVNAPMLSLDASGKLAGALVFSKWKGRNYVRSLVTPTNPRSAGQVGMRRMLRFLSQAWTNITDTRQNTWDARADAAVISAFNAYVGYNMARWRNFNAPTQLDPATNAATTANLINETATAGVRQIEVSGDIDGAGDHWGVMIFRATATPVTTAWTNLVQAIATPLHQKYRWIDTPLAAGTYYYNFRLFSHEGYLGAEETEVNATVT